MRTRIGMDTSSGILARFIPVPDARERFETTIRAPAAIVMEVAANFDMQSLPAVRAIFRLREALLGSAPTAPRRPQGLLDETRSLGWGLLVDEPGRRLVCGAVCRPWLADVTFSPIASDDYVGYAEPDRVKIAWSLEADEIGPAITRFAQETRAAATDDGARVRFLRYWRWARFGIVTIRWLMLPAIRKAAERRWALERDRQ